MVIKEDDFCWKLETDYGNIYIFKPLYPLQVDFNRRLYVSRSICDSSLPGFIKDEIRKFECFLKRR